MKKRDVSYELIRVFAMFFIVFDHNLNTYIGKDASQLIEPFLAVGVTLFFMLSGKFAFKLNLEDKSLYKKYYWKKVLGLIIPMLVFMAIKNWHIMVYNQHLAVTPLSYLRHFGVALVNGFSYMEYWFLYTLIALLVAVPFTTHMMQNLKPRDKKAFLVVSLVMGALSAIIPSVLNVSFAVNYYFMGHAFYFFLGYIIEDIFEKNPAKKKLYIAGALSFIATLVLVELGKKSGYKSYSPLFTVFSAAMFIGIHNLGKKLPSKLEKPILFIGKHSLSIYMLHLIFLYTLRDLHIFPTNALGWVACSLAGILITLVAGWILDSTVVKWLQKLTVKIFRLESVLKTEK